MDLTHSEEIASAIRARHVQTPIERVMAFPDTGAAQDAADALAAANFDFAPVTSLGDISGFVRAGELAEHVGAVGERRHPLTASCLVAGDAPIAMLLPALSRSPFLFVVDGRDIVGVVTPADMNKQPGRTYFYLLVAALEICLAEWVRAAFPAQSDAVAVLSNGRRDAIQARLAAEVRDDVLADAVAAMDLTDLLVVVERTAWMRAVFGDYTSGRWRNDVCAPVVGLRHDVMHSVRTLATDTPSSLRRLISLDTMLHQLLAAITATDARELPQREITSR